MYTLGPSDDSDPPFNGMREFWQRSHWGRFVSSYDAGVAMGKEDLTNDDEANLVKLISSGGVWDDFEWEARVDGYSDATRRERGENPLSKF